MDVLDYIFKDKKLSSCIRERDFNGLHEIKKQQFLQKVKIYKMGRCTEEELQAEMDRWLYEGWNELFRYLGIRDIQADNDAYVDFVQQYEKWIQNTNDSEINVEIKVQSKSGLVLSEIFEVLNALYIAPCFLKRIEQNIEADEENEEYNNALSLLQQERKMYIKRLRVHFEVD